MFFLVLCCYINANELKSKQSLAEKEAGPAFLWRLPHFLPEGGTNAILCSLQIPGNLL